MKRVALLLMLAAAIAFAAGQEAAQDPPAASKPAEKTGQAAQSETKSEAKPDAAAAADASSASAASKPAEKTGQAAQSETKAEAKPDAAAADASSASTAKEKTLEGNIDVGYRWVSSPVGGDMNTYRSIVNLGSGLRVVNVDLKLVPPPHEKKFADSVLLQAHDWGDPYNTMRLDMQKNGVYRFTSSYSNIAYFNYLPSYADPTMSTTGVFMNQRAYDTNTRIFDNELVLLPGYWIEPYLAYSRNTDTGMGLSTIVDGSNNQYPVVNNIHWGQNTIRGGVRVQLPKLHLTFEQGANAFRDDQSTNSNGYGIGDRTTLYQGQQLYLTEGWQAYYVRSDGNFTKGYGTFSPTSWIDVYGQIYYSAPHLSSTLSQLADGNLPAYTPNLTFYSTAFDQVYGSAVMPRTSGSLSTELRFLNRIRIRQSFDTDKFHDDSSATLSRLYSLSSGLGSNIASDFMQRLEVEQHRSQTEVLVDVGKQLMLRGGFRYEWGNASVPSGLSSTTTPNEAGELVRYITLAGAQYRLAKHAVFNVDFEGSNGGQTYYRTGLQDYAKVRVQARFTLPQNLFLNVGLHYLDNSNPDSGVNAKYTSAVESASLQWVPGHHRISLIADYTHSHIKSDINYITPFPFSDENRSLYVDNATAVSMMAELALPGKGVIKPKLSFGGSVVGTSGSRPSRYYQPQGKLLVPLGNRVQVYTEWQWYALNQPFYMYEGFRAHTLLTGVRFLM